MNNWGHLYHNSGDPPLNVEEYGNVHGPAPHNCMREMKYQKKFLYVRLVALQVQKQKFMPQSGHCVEANS